MKPATQINDRLSKVIRRQMGGETTTRFLRSLPLFRAGDGMPDELQELLDQMDEQEAKASHSRH